jgi:hypothetical protein
MSNYARLPVIAQETNKQEQEQIFKKPPVAEHKEVLEVSEDKVEDKPLLSNEEQKKQSLKDHLAKCRIKSIETRKAKALEKKANKKSVGRPKKDKEASPLQTEFKPKVIYDKPNVNLEVVEEVKKVAPLIQVLETPELIPIRPTTNKGLDNNIPSTNMGFDYEKLADMIAGRMKPTHTPQVSEKKVEPQIVNNQSQVGNFLSSYGDLIRQQERTKIQEEKKENQKNNLNNATKSYYKKLPPVNLIPSDNAWDNIFNPR